MKDFCIVGSGIAGSTIANLLSKKYSIEIFDKARGPGGRASNRRYKDHLSFDHGLQYISPKSNKFKEFILELKNKYILKEWSGQHLDFNFERKEKTIKYIGSKGNNDICKYLIKNMTPNRTAMVVYENYEKLPINSIKFKDEIISWAAQENTKDRFKANQIVWTIQCTDIFSKKIINLLKNKKKKYESIIFKRFEKLLGYKTKNIVFKNLHGWRYAYNKLNTNLDTLWSDKDNLGVCADWFNGPYAECAWLSANSLYKKIKKNPPKNRRV